jgi:hypothetical protein
MRFASMVSGHEWSWMKDRAHQIACEDSQGLVAYDKEGKILACAVTDSFTVDSCNAHIAIDNPLVIRAGFIDAICEYAFGTRDKKRIFVLVASTNAKALRFVMHLGFREITRVPDAIKDGVDYVILRMDRTGCRWFTELKEAA